LAVKKRERRGGRNRVREGGTSEIETRTRRKNQEVLCYRAWLEEREGVRGGGGKRERVEIDAKGEVVKEARDFCVKKKRKEKIGLGQRKGRFFFFLFFLLEHGLVSFLGKEGLVFSRVCEVDLEEPALDGWRMQCEEWGSVDCGRWRGRVGGSTGRGRG
jgi:hypothetical protein